MFHDLETRSTGFTLAFPKADLDVNIFIEAFQGFDIGGSTGSRIIKVNKLLYGLCQSS